MLSGSSTRRRTAGPRGAIWLPSPAPGPSRTASVDTPASPFASTPGARLRTTRGVPPTPPGAGVIACPSPRSGSQPRRSSPACPGRGRLEDSPWLRPSPPQVAGADDDKRPRSSCSRSERSPLPPGSAPSLGPSAASCPPRGRSRVATTLAVLGALRESGVLRIPLPDLRRQVPEPWRREKPLAFWSTGYGLILGSGFGTFQPVATFWVVCAGAVALGHPLVAALCLAPFGLGRAIMVAFPGDDPLRRLAGAHRLLRPVNAAVLAAAAAAPACRRWRPARRRRCPRASATRPYRGT